jgi:hypothetical protein
MRRHPEQNLDAVLRLLQIPLNVLYFLTRLQPAA